MIKKIHVYDLDGVLCDSSSRFKAAPCGTKVDLMAWRESQPLAFFDGVLPMAEQYRQDLKNPDIFVVIATARFVDWSGRAWLEHKLGWPQHLISRKTENDPIGGADLKIKGIKKLLNLKQFKSVNDIIVYEDNIKYLKKLCDTFKCQGVYIPSNQGH